MEVLCYSRDRQSVRRVAVLLAAQPVARNAEVHEIHLPDPAPASRFGGSDRVLYGCEHTKQKILDLIGMGRQRIADEIRREESSRSGDDGLNPTYGSNEIRSVASEWVEYTPKLGDS